MLCSCTGRINIIKKSILPKKTYTLNTIPIKIPMIPFTDENKDVKIYMELKMIPNICNNVEKEDHSRRDHNN